MEQTETRAKTLRTRQGEFSWADLAAKDLDGQTAFYEGLFGWTHVDLPTDAGPVYRMFMLGDSRVAGASQMTPEAYPQGMPSVWNTYIYAEDVEEVARRAEELGGKVVMPAMDVMKEGRMVGIQDPTGGAVFFWQPGAHGGAERFAEPGALIWHDLSSPDPEAAAAFFSTLLGWEIERFDQFPAPYWRVSVAGQAEGGIMPMPENLPREVPPSWLVYFGTSDLRASMKRAEELGGRVDVGPMDIDSMSFAILSDPQDAVFAMMQPGR